MFIWVQYFFGNTVYVLLHACQLKRNSDSSVFDYTGTQKQAGHLHVLANAAKCTEQPIFLYNFFLFIKEKSCPVLSLPACTQ